MNDILSIGSMILLVSPIVIGAVAAFALWFGDEFWKDPLYSDED